jgi:hypothetical protein
MDDSRKLVDNFPASDQEDFNLRYVQAFYILMILIHWNLSFRAKTIYRTGHR